MSESLDVRAKRVFDQVIDRRDPDRTMSLRQLCAGDQVLRRRVEVLLASAEKEDSFLAAPTLQAAEVLSADRGIELPGTRIGPYTLHELLGEGGFGSVFLAEQTSPVRRSVALKIIKAGMDTKQVIARFEAERQALAMMDHPNIARVFEAGATDGGRPYFVMELVRGEPITRYCDRERLSVAERLGLFRDVCSAVQHAHQKGIIHRDLKPSNILVTGADGGSGLVKVIDFGIAKATFGRLTDDTLTARHQFIGTPEYMSPEQVDPSGAEIDTRGDIYSLGALLYELLTGATPFNRGRLAASGFDGMRRIICDEEPTPPSIRVNLCSNARGGESAGARLPHRGPSSSASDAPRLSGTAADQDSSAIEIAGRRRAEPRTLSRRLRGDLDWIVLKCLEKDRARRYETASALADDVKRYLDQQPVMASPPRSGYRLWKFVRRNSGAVIAGGFIAMTLVMGFVVSLAFAIQASRASRVAEEQRELALKNERETRKVSQFQAAMLAGIDVQSLGVEFKKRFREQVKDGLSRRVVGEWPNRRKLTSAEVSAEMAEYDRVAETVQHPDIARRLLDEFILGHGLEAVHAQFVDQPNIQAELLYTLGKISRSLGLYPKAVPALRRSLELRRLDPACEDLTLADTLSELGSALGMTGQSEEAERLQREALAVYGARLGDGHERTIACINQLAVSLSERGDYAGAEALLREALEPARRLPADGQETLGSVLNSLAGATLSRGDYAAAEPFAREAVEVQRRALGDASLEVAEGLNNLAGCLYARRDYEAAQSTLIECLKIKRNHLGDEHVEVATIINNLGGVARRRGDRESAKAHYVEALAMYRRLLGDEHPDVALTLSNLAMMNLKQGNLAISGPMLREALELRRRLLAPDHTDLALSVANLALQLEEEGDLPEAESLYREAVAVNAAKLTPCQSFRVTAETGLLRVLGKLGKLDEMESLLETFYAPVKASQPDKPCVNDYVRSFASLYDAREQQSPGLGFAEKAAEWRATTQPVQTP